MVTDRENLIVHLLFHDSVSRRKKRSWNVVVVLSVDALLGLQRRHVGRVVAAADHLGVLLLVLAQHLGHRDQRLQRRLKQKRIAVGKKIAQHIALNLR